MIIIKVLDFKMHVVFVPLSNFQLLILCMLKDDNNQSFRLQNSAVYFDLEGEFVLLNLILNGCKSDTLVDLK